jgi:hypothetical protein
MTTFVNPPQVPFWDFENMAKLTQHLTLLSVLQSIQGDPKLLYHGCAVNGAYAAKGLHTVYKHCANRCQYYLAMVEKRLK